jgi:hypothetical protein
VEINAMTPPRSQNGDVAGRKAKTPKSATVSPIRIKLNVTKRSEDADVKQEAVKNAASRGKSLLDVLSGKENKTKAVKSKTSHNKKPRVTKIRASGKLQSQGVITGRITKPVDEVGSSGMRKSLPEPLSPRRDANDTAKAVKSEFSSVDASPVPETPPSDMVSLLN